jgi:hypothetical protein
MCDTYIWKRPSYSYLRNLSCHEGKFYIRTVNVGVQLQKNVVFNLEGLGSKTNSTLYVKWSIEL